MTIDVIEKILWQNHKMNRKILFKGFITLLVDFLNKVWNWRIYRSEPTLTKTAVSHTGVQFIWTHFAIILRLFISNA